MSQIFDLGHKPIVHQALVGRVGAGNARCFALGTFEIFCSPPK